MMRSFKAGELFLEDKQASLVSGLYQLIVSRWDSISYLARLF